MDPSVEISKLQLRSNILKISLRSTLTQMTKKKEAKPVVKSKYRQPTLSFLRKTPPTVSTTQAAPQVAHLESGSTLPTMKVLGSTPIVSIPIVLLNHTPSTSSILQGFRSGPKTDHNITVQKVIQKTIKKPEPSAKAIKKQPKKTAAIVLPSGTSSRPHVPLVKATVPLIPRVQTYDEFNVGFEKLSRLVEVSGEGEMRILDLLGLSSFFTTFQHILRLPSIPASLGIFYLT